MFTGTVSYADTSYFDVSPVTPNSKVKLSQNNNNNNNNTISPLLKCNNNIPLTPNKKFCPSPRICDFSSPKNTFSSSIFQQPSPQQQQQQQQQNELTTPGRRVRFDLGNGKLRAPTDEPTPLFKALTIPNNNNSVNSQSPLLSFSLPDFLNNNCDGSSGNNNNNATKSSPMIKFTLPDFSKPSPALQPQNQIPMFQLPDSLENTPVNQNTNPNQNSTKSPLRSESGAVMYGKRSSDLTPLDLP